MPRGGAAALAAGGGAQPGPTGPAPEGPRRGGEETPRAALKERLWKGSNHVKKSQLADFFRFLQCQLHMEARERLGKTFELEEAEAADMWPLYEEWVRPNIGKREKWMPYHTVLGTHELFAVQNIHHAEGFGWDDRQKFVAMFVYRAHCKGDVFNTVQLPKMKCSSFWNDPIGSFERGSPLYDSMLEYRKTTRNPLQTSAFRAIPKRLLPNDDENMVLNVARRTQTLLQAADRIWPLLADSSRTVKDLYVDIEAALRQGDGLGETWTKMLMVSIDIMRPKIGLLAKNCEVGVGAMPGLKLLLSCGKEAERRPQAALEAVVQAGNRDRNPSVQHFWSLLPRVEDAARKSYESLPLVTAQMRTPDRSISAATVQVQLCEWRQFVDFRQKAGALGQSPGGGASSASPAARPPDSPAAPPSAPAGPLLGKRKRPEALPYGDALAAARDALGRELARMQDDDLRRRADEEGRARAAGLARQRLGEAQQQCDSASAQLRDAERAVAVAEELLAGAQRQLRLQEARLAALQEANGHVERALQQIEQPPFAASPQEWRVALLGLGGSAPAAAAEAVEAVASASQGQAGSALADALSERRRRLGLMCQDAEEEVRRAREAQALQQRSYQDNRAKSEAAQELQREALSAHDAACSAHQTAVRAARAPAEEDAGAVDASLLALGAEALALLAGPQGRHDAPEA